jgi:hypothetical protein
MVSVRTPPWELRWVCFGKSRLCWGWCSWAKSCGKEAFGKNKIAGIHYKAFVIWGVLSILLSPCHLANISLIVGFIDGQRRVTNRRALRLASLFAIGILISIAIIGMVSLGRMMGDVGAYGNYIVAAIFFLVGLYLFGTQYPGLA